MAKGQNPEARWSLYRAGPDMVYRDGAFGEVRWPEGRVEPWLVQGPDVPAAPSSALGDALARPLGSGRLSVLARGRRTVAIITSDATRSVPCAALLDCVVPELLEAGVQPSDITLVVGVGAHRLATDAEMRRYLGKWAGLIRAESHDAHDRGGLVKVGSTSVGDVEINRTVASADLRVAFGQVEPHEFAGFSGGPKSVLAGVSGAETIRRNHSPTMLSDRRARPGTTAGNPVWEDMLAAAELVGLEFIVNVVVNSAGAVASARAGSLTAAHTAAVEDYKLLYAARLPDGGSADVLVTTPGSPLDINLYQCLKALVAGEPYVKDNGIVLLYGSCQEGIGHPDFSKPFEMAGTPAGVIGLLADDGFYTAPMDHALLLANLQVKRGIQVVLCAPGVPKGTAATMGFMVEDTLQNAFEQCLTSAGWRSEPARVILFPCPQKAVLT